MLNKLIEITRQYLDFIDADYKFREDCTSFEIKIKGESDTFKESEIYISVDDENMIVYNFLFFSTEVSNKGDFLKLLNKININIENGQFVYDAGINGVCCRSYIDCFSIVPTIEMIEDSFNSVKSLTVKYGEIIVDVANGGSLSENELNNLLKTESEDGAVY